MIRFVIFVGVLLFIIIGGFMLKTRNNKTNQAQEIITMNIISPAFGHNQSIPKKYTCDGENMSPPLLIREVLSDAKSLALIMEDPDVPKNIRPDGMWDHWLVWDIPVDTKEIPEGKEPQGTVGKNSGGGSGYIGPCPPDREHRYFFKLYALDVASLSLDKTVSKKELQKAMASHILAEAELVGRYQRQ